MTSRRGRLRILPYFLLLLGRPALAADEVETLIDQGITLRESGNDAEALTRFRKAFELSKGARAQAQMGLAEQALGDWVRAELDITAALSASNDPWIHQHEAPLREALTTVREHLGDVEVLGGVTGAELTLDGVSAGKLPLLRPVRGEVGSHTLEVHAPGYYPVNKSVLITPNGTSRVSLTMMPLSEAPSTPASPPPAAVSLPRADVGNQSPPIAAWVFAGSGVALAGLGTGAMFARAAQIGKYNDDPSCPGTAAADQPAGCKSHIDSSKTWTAVAWTGFVGAGVLGGLATYFFLRPKVAQSDTTATACGLTIGAPGMVCRGTF
jgi:hypothetical protein